MLRTKQRLQVLAEQGALAERVAPLGRALCGRRRRPRLHRDRHGHGQWRGQQLAQQREAVVGVEGLGEDVAAQLAVEARLQARLARVAFKVRKEIF